MKEDVANAGAEAEFGGTAIQGFARKYGDHTLRDVENFEALRASPATGRPSRRDYVERACRAEQPLIELSGLRGQGACHDAL